MKKKLLSVMLAVTLSVSCMTPLMALAEEGEQAGTTEDQDEQEDGVALEGNIISEEDETVLKNGTATIVKKGGIGDAEYTLDTDGNLTISGDGQIFEGSFENWTDIKRVEILSGITDIGDRAFLNCSNLRSINIQEGVITIGGSAFSECSSLSSISIPMGVTNIGYSAFSGCSSLSSISIPASVTNIGYNAFSRCSSLSSISIPASVTNIGDWAFSGCSSLSSISIPASVTNIGKFTFNGCNSLSSITVASGNSKYDSRNNCNAIIESNTNTLIQGCKTTFIPQSVISIGDRAFWGCNNLSSITIPKGVTSIGEDAFVDCSNLNNIELPEGLTSISYAVFRGCSNLKSIVIPSSVTSIEPRAFDGCSSLKSITIPEEVSIIGNGAFLDCSSLSSITIPSSVYMIDEDAFKGCNNLNSIVIPEEVIAIEKNAFEGCDNLTISCYKDSAAHKYAVENKINYKLLDAKPSQTKTDIKSATIVINDLNYNKKAQTVSPKVSISGKTLTQGKDYTVSGNTTVTDIGTYKITITGIGEYTGSVNVTYRLSCKHNYGETWTVDKKADMKNAGKKSHHCTICNAKADETVIRAIKTASLSKTSFTYNGKNRKPSVTVRDSKGNTLKKGTDYTISYPKNCKKVGQYTVTIKFKGNYTGSTKKIYCINPKGTSLNEVKAKSKSFTAKWKKQTTQTRGYRLQYATDKKFKKNVKNVTIKKNKTTSQTVKKLKAKKKYYVRIRTYQTIKVNGKEKKLYSDWSKTKNVTVKK